MPSPIVPISRWQANLLRLTVFLQAPLQDTTTVWHDFAAADPEVDEFRSREGMRRQFGGFGGAALEVQASAPRIDFLLTPAAPTDTPPGPPSFPPTVFGAAGEKLGLFCEAVRGWLAEATPNTLRIAFGAILMIPVSSRAEGYGYLSRLLQSVEVDADTTEELLYRVNRPKQSQTNGSLRLNRIMTWSCLRFRAFTTAGAMPGPGIPTLRLGEEHFVRLEVDNSTPAERSEPLETSQVGAIYDELVRMAIENAENGELP
ncbi:MAG TPA: hypothetical protein VEU47_04020 [Candidatus Cybelea sp.]|nr:hypothetical protein [Candidatus Cybelea sp.]